MLGIQHMPNTTKVLSRYEGVVNHTSHAFKKNFIKISSLVQHIRDYLRVEREVCWSAACSGAATGAHLMAACHLSWAWSVIVPLQCCLFSVELRPSELWRSGGMESSLPYKTLKTTEQEDLHIIMWNFALNVHLVIYFNRLSVCIHFNASTSHYEYKQKM